MVARTFFAIDSANFVVTSSSSAAIVGNGVINNSSTPDGTIFSYTSGSGQAVTINDTGGSADVFEDDNAANHVVTDGAGLVASGQTVEAESLIFVRALDGAGNPTGPVITITVFSQGGVTGDVWGFSSDTPLVDGTSYVKTGGSNAGSSPYSSFVACFAGGTLIDTRGGPRSIDTLKVGDLIVTRDNGDLPIRWIGHRRLAAVGPFAPVCIDTGALDNTAPLTVSPEHRMLVQHPMLEMLFGVSSALVAAKHLVGLHGITQTEVSDLTYYHLMFDTHETVRASGCWSESFFLADNSLGGLENEAQAEICALFPSLKAGKDTFGSAAEMVLKSYEASLFKDVLLDQAEFPMAA